LSVTIFGILNIGFALFEFLLLLISSLVPHAKLPGHSFSMEPTTSNLAWAHFAAVWGAAQALMLVVAGIGLLLMQAWARVLSVIYSIVCILYILVSAVVNFPTFHAMVAGVPGLPRGLIPVVTFAAAFIGLIIGLAYPILLLVFMTRPKVVAAFAPEPPPPPLPPRL
jgi:hypothetical protein